MCVCIYVVYIISLDWYVAQVIEVRPEKNVFYIICQNSW